jgi:hypothetical protein
MAWLGYVLRVFSNIGTNETPNLCEAVAVKWLRRIWRWLFGPHGILD